MGLLPVEWKFLSIPTGTGCWMSVGTPPRERNCFFDSLRFVFEAERYFDLLEVVLFAPIPDVCCLKALPAADAAPTR